MRQTMGMTIHDVLNERFSKHIATAMERHFQIEVETNFGLLSFRHITTKIDGTDFTQEQIDFMRGFESGYAEFAMEDVYGYRRGDTP